MVWFEVANPLAKRISHGIKKNTSLQILLLLAKSKSKEIASWDVTVWFKGWSIGYFFTKLLVALWMRVYFRKFYAEGYRNIDWSKPLLIVSNHQNAFLDALSILVKPPEQLYYMTRSDVFYSAIARFFLKMYHMIPIFRQRDGVNSQQANENIFELTYDMLANGRSILIFPEGNCVPRNTLRTFRKGPARMAFGAMEAYNMELDLHILPVGVIYSDHTAFRGDLHIRYGDPIPVKKYLSLYDEKSERAYRQITQDLQHAIKELVVDVPDTQNRELVNFTLDVASRRDKWSNWGSSKLREINEVRKRVGDRLASWFDEANERYSQILNKAEAYRSNLKQAGIGDPIVNRSISTNIAVVTFIKALLILLLAPVTLPAWLIHIGPYRFIEGKATSVREEQFISSIRFTIQMVVFPLLYIILAGAAAIITGSIVIGGAVLIALPISGVILLRSRILLRDVRDGWQWMKLRRSQPEFVANLVKLRQQLLSELKDI